MSMLGRCKNGVKMTRHYFVHHLCKNKMSLVKSAEWNLWESHLMDHPI